MTVPPGLTCADCQQPLAPHLAVRTLDGWEHAGRCPCKVNDCPNPRHAGGYCNPHYGRMKRHGNPLAGNRANIKLHIEDIEWMAENGESLSGAAARLGVTVSALDRHLRRGGHTDIITTLLRHEPRDWNHPVNRHIGTVA